MLSFDTRSLETKAALVDGVLAVDDAVWQPDDQRPARPIHVTGRLSSAGSGRYFLSGRMRGEIRLDCRRCLQPVDEVVDEELQLLFVEPGDDEADDPDVYLVEARTGEVDLRAALREQWLLTVPLFALCDDACKGLCPTCGADRNAVSCDCPPAGDVRWDALRSHARDS